VKTAYQLWQDALAAEFFGEDHALRSTVLYIDSEVERELMERYGLESTLTDAVSEELDWDSPNGSLFSPVLRRRQRWTQLEGAVPPPVLPVLGLSVLAASRMASSDGMRKTNFYGRWTQLFDEQPSTFWGAMLEKNFQDVAVMWEDLHSWMNEMGGLCGVSTISTGDPYWKIGYPISQALVRGSDRQVLTRFFAATRLRPHNENQVSGRELLRRLRAWTAGRDRHLSVRLLQEIAAAPDVEDSLVTRLLKRLADDWDGYLHEPDRQQQRRRALPLRLMITERGRSLAWLADAGDSLDQADVAYNGEGRQFHLRREYGDVYSGLESLAPSTHQLAAGFRLEGDNLVLEWVPVDVVLLRMHPQLGEWVSTEYFEPGEHHWILAADSAADEVRKMVNALGGRTVREATAPVPGWKIFKGVRAVSDSSFTRTLDSGGDHTHVLEPQLRTKTELVGGLRIASEQYRAGGSLAGHYLRGGEPDLLLPASDSADGLVEVLLDDRSQKLRRDPRMPFPLSCIPLEEGEHRVGTAGSSKVFTVFDGLNEGVPFGTGTLGYRCNTSANPLLSEVDENDFAIRGARLPASAAKPHRMELIRLEVREAYLIHPQGLVREIVQTPVPEWKTKEKGKGETKAPRVPAELHSPCFEVAVPEGYAWLVYRTAARWKIRALLPDNRIPDPTPAEDDRLWASAVLAARGHAAPAAWTRYVAAAEEIERRSGAL
jgi:hypothetical protein